MIIIGAGPAGCAAAIRCRQLGLQPVLLAGPSAGPHPDNPRSEPSESVHPGIASLLSLLGAETCLAAASRGTYEGIVAGGRFTPLGADAHGPWQGHHISRTRFDAALLRAARQQDVAVRYETVAEILSGGDRVTGVVTLAGEQIACRYLIDASGPKGLAGRKLRFRVVFHSPPLAVWTGVSEHIPAAWHPAKGNATTFIPQAAGWTWLAPEPQGRCTWTRLQRKGATQFSPPEELSGFPLAGDIRVSNRRWRLFRPVCREGVLLCGDAAGILDPAAGQGILNALHSGIMAAQTVGAAIAQPDFEALHLAQYDQWFSNSYLDKAERLKGVYAELGIEL